MCVCVCEPLTISDVGRGQHKLPGALDPLPTPALLAKPNTTTGAGAGAGDLVGALEGFRRLENVGGYFPRKPFKLVAEWWDVDRFVGSRRTGVRAGGGGRKARHAGKQMQENMLCFFVV